MGRILGVDFGETRIGLALTDENQIIAYPLEVINYKGSYKRAAYLVAEKARQWEVELIVVGMPYMMNGTSGEKAKETHRFAQYLTSIMDLPVAEWDERLSTVQASRLMRQAGVKEKKQRGKLDKIAASIVLESYLFSQEVDSLPLGYA